MSKFPDSFFFGVSNAAGQVEDQLSNNWSRFADNGQVPQFQKIPLASDRIRFWSQPFVDLDLAQELGCDVFRLSFAWERLVPQPGVWDEQAAKHYLEILNMIEARGMKVMASLFHHSVPIWFEDQHGWVNPQSVEHFQFYSEMAHKTFGHKVQYWITLNEPVPWSLLTYTRGLFPPGRKGPWSHHFRALQHMADAHNQFYHFVGGLTPVGIAHHMGFHTGRGLFNKLLSYLTDYLAHWTFLKKIRNSMSFFGINYYGAEWMTLKGPAQYADLEFSDAGRAVNPQGLAILLERIHRKYPALPIIITENGVGDSTDSLRPAYLLEHLAVIRHLIDKGIPIRGYIHWTITDNWEWTDGYGPKFGLVEVLRDEELRRLPRPSFKLYQSVINKREFSAEQREKAWQDYRRTIGQSRPYWRADDGEHGLEEPLKRKVPDHDWQYRE